MSATKPTTTDKLARFYMDHADRPIRRYEIGRIVGQGSVTQRHSDLRKRGFVIRPVRRKERGRVVTYYTYVSPAKRTRAA